MTGRVRLMMIHPVLYLRSEEEFLSDAAGFFFENITMM